MLMASISSVALFLLLLDVRIVAKHGILEGKP
jgi:hypothetical protein